MGKAFVLKVPVYCYNSFRFYCSFLLFVEQCCILIPLEVSYLYILVHLIIMKKQKKKKEKERAVVLCHLTKGPIGFNFQTISSIMMA